MNMRGSAEENDFPEMTGAGPRARSIFWYALVNIIS
jgi:hypothetical protein